MTYSFVVKSGWFCRCDPKLTQKMAKDTWSDWKLCGKCRLPIQGSNPASVEDGYSKHRI